MLWKRTLFLVAVVPFLGGRGSLSGTEVKLDGARVIVQATSVPLTDVLTRFSEATGTKIVYDSAKPRQLVSVAIDVSSQAEALSQLLEGQGLSYALRLDASGRGVEMLFLSKSQGATSSPGSGVAASRGEIDPREAEAAIDELQAMADEIDPEGQPAVPVQLASPVPDPQIDPVGGAPGGAPRAPAPFFGAPVAPAAPWQPSGPSFPQRASYPAWR
jgi:hypothetical protein